MQLMQAQSAQVKGHRMVGSNGMEKEKEKGGEREREREGVIGGPVYSLLLILYRRHLLPFAFIYRTVYLLMKSKRVTNNFYKSVREICLHVPVLTVCLIAPPHFL